VLKIVRRRRGRPYRQRHDAQYDQQCNEQPCGRSNDWK
jgi:hypothetical protein